jgi:hypothetical protein
MPVDRLVASPCVLVFVDACNSVCDRCGTCLQTCGMQLGPLSSSVFVIGLPRIQHPTEALGEMKRIERPGNWRNNAGPPV